MKRKESQRGGCWRGQNLKQLEFFGIGQQRSLHRNQTRCKTALDTEAVGDTWDNEVTSGHHEATVGESGCALSLQGTLHLYRSTFETRRF